MVVLAIIGTAAGLAGVALRPAATQGPVEWVQEVQRLKRLAIQSGRPHSSSLVIGGREYAITALPSGEVVTDPILEIDAFSGRIRRSEP